jgi:hypothetical protein
MTEKGGDVSEPTVHSIASAAWVTDDPYHDQDQYRPAEYLLERPWPVLSPSVPFPLLFLHANHWILTPDLRLRPVSEN